MYAFPCRKASHKNLPHQESCQRICIPSKQIKSHLTSTNNIYSFHKRIFHSCDKLAAKADLMHQKCGLLLIHCTNSMLCLKYSSSLCRTLFLLCEERMSTNIFWYKKIKMRLECCNILLPSYTKPLMWWWSYMNGTNPPLLDSHFLQEGVPRNLLT